jgi:hypothetical protein
MHRTIVASAAVLIVRALATTIPAAAAADLIDADRPGIADGSSVVGARRLQLETGVQAEFRGAAHAVFVPTLLRLGIADRWEARVEGNTFTWMEDDGKDASGFAPLSLGGKYQLTESQGTTHPSLGALARVFPPWGAHQLRSHHVTGDLRLAADWEFAPQLSLNPNLGIAIDEDDSGDVFPAALVAATLHYEPTDRLNPFVDVGLQAPEADGGETAVVFDGGLAYIVQPNVELDASAGTRVHGETPPRPFVTVGISIRFDGGR